MSETGEGSPKPESFQRKAPVNVEKRYIEGAGSRTGRILRRLEMAARVIGLRLELIRGPDEEAIKRQVWEERQNNPAEPIHSREVDTFPPLHETPSEKKE